MQALGETDPITKDFYEGVSRTAELNADGIRLGMGLRPEHDEANTILTEERVVTPDIISQTSERVDDLFETRMEELESASGEIHLTEQEVREFARTLNPVGTDAEKIEALELNAEYFRMKALREVDPAKETFYKGVSETAELSADRIRLEMGLKPEHDEAKAVLNKVIDEDDLGRFKRWARENLLGLSAVAISIAGIITTAVMGTRKAVVAGAKPTGRFAKALAKLAKEAGPLLSGLLNLLSQVVSLGARAVSWLAGNLCNDVTKHNL